MERRRKLGRRYRSGSLFSCRIVCGDCGEFFGPKVWNSTSKYRRTIWQCNAKFKGDRKCTTPHLTEDAIKEKFIEAFNRLIPDREQLIRDCRVIQTELTDCTEIDREIDAAVQGTEVIAGLVQRCVEENSRSALDQEAYLARYNGLVERYEAAGTRLKSLEKKRTARLQKADAIGGFMFALAERGSAVEVFTDGLWIDSIDLATVHHSSGSVTFRFQNGNDVTV